MKWFAVNTKPRNEDLAAKNLEVKGVEIFLPKIQVARRRGSCKYKTLEPLFPGYLFVRIKSEPRWIDRVNWTPGMRRLVCFGDIPAPVPDAAVELVRQRVGPRDQVLPRADFAPGTRVAIRHGPFAGLVGVVDKPMSGRGRVRVLLEFLQKSTLVECDAVTWTSFATPPRLHDPEPARMPHAHCKSDAQR